MSNWSRIGDKTSVTILNDLKVLSQQHRIYLQWIPSHIGLAVNKTTDILTKEPVFGLVNLESPPDFLRNIFRSKDHKLEVMKSEISG